MGYLAALVALAATAAYGIRAGVQMVNDTWPDRIMRGVLVALLFCIAVAFVDVARERDTLLWRQWPIFTCLLALAVAAAWPRKPRDP